MGYKIKEYRLQQKITQEELAEKAGVTRVTICNLENGTQNDVKVGNLKKIAAALGVEVAELL
jgi:transcriptional regulator with XRE-family HTH domain